jgi:hypothetical protein
MDFDRGTGASRGLESGPLARDEYIGIGSMWQPSPPPQPAPVVEAIVPGPSGALIAGPPQTGRLISDPAIIRPLQQALGVRGYYHGPISGTADASLSRSLAQFQADHRLPVTGQLDGESARELGVTLPSPPPPRAG